MIWHNDIRTSWSWLLKLSVAFQVPSCTLFFSFLLVLLFLSSTISNVGYDILVSVTIHRFQSIHYYYISIIMIIIMFVDLSMFTTQCPSISFVEICKEQLHAFQCIYYFNKVSRMICWLMTNTASRARATHWRIQRNIQNTNAVISPHDMYQSINQ